MIFLYFYIIPLILTLIFFKLCSKININNKPYEWMLSFIPLLNIFLLIVATIMFGAFFSQSIFEHLGIMKYIKQFDEWMRK